MLHVIGKGKKRASNMHSAKPRIFIAGGFALVYGVAAGHPPQVDNALVVLRWNSRLGVAYSEIRTIKISPSKRMVAVRSDRVDFVDHNHLCGRALFFVTLGEDRIS